MVVVRRSQADAVARAPIMAWSLPRFNPLPVARQAGALETSLPPFGRDG